MRIHADNLTSSDLYRAAEHAKADLDYIRHGSRSRAIGWEVSLRGDSNRRPNFYNGDGSFAATWDQWGVFLSSLFDTDPTVTIPTAYVDGNAFSTRTNNRFDPQELREDVTYTEAEKEEGVTYWPTDAHGDHTFRFEGVAGENNCTKCSAIRRWFS